MQTPVGRIRRRAGGPTGQGRLSPARVSFPSGKWQAARRPILVSRHASSGLCPPRAAAPIMVQWRGTAGRKRFWRMRWQTVARERTRPGHSGPKQRPPATCRASATISKRRRCRVHCPSARIRRSARHMGSTPSSCRARPSPPRVAPTSAPGSTASVRRCSTRRGSRRRCCHSGRRRHHLASTTARSASCVGAPCRCRRRSSRFSRACAP